MTVSILLSACGLSAKPVSVPPGAKAGDLTLSPCSVETQNGKVDGDCGTLLVPENRSNPSSRLIALPVVRVRAQTSGASEPVFWLEGGPGQTNLAKPPAWMFANRDVVFVGYRGVDGSVRLDCPEYAKAIGEAGDVFASVEGRAAITNAMNACAKRLQSEGADLAGYTVAEVAADLEAARAALGYERINLYSLSYGTRVAQIYGTLYPDRAFRSAMVGVNPPGHFVWEPDRIDAQIRHYSDLCAADPVCSARTPDLAGTMLKVSHEMPRQWLVFPIHPDKVKMTAFFMLFHKNTAALVFDAYLAAEKGDASGLAMLSLAADLIIPNLGAWGDFFSKGFSADFDAGRNYAADLNPPGSIMGSPFSQVLWTNDFLWPTPVIPEILRRVQPSDVQTLLVSGSVDFSTPAETATQELLPSLRNGQQVILREMGHTGDLTSLQPEAFARLITSFYDTGQADDSLYQYDPMKFETPLGLPLIAKILAGVGVALVLLAGLAIWLIIRRFTG